LLILAGAGGAALLCVVLGFLLFGKTTPTNVTGPGGGGSSVGGSTTVAGPRFVNVPLDGSRVVYVLDCGSASQNIFDPLKHAVYQSLKSLGPEREFQVILWQRGGGEEKPVAYPENGTARATPDHIAACQAKLADEIGQGSTQVDEAIQLAMVRQPDAVVLATAKQYLDEKFVQVVEQARAGADVKIHAIDMGGDSEPLKEIARKSGGRYITVTREVLERL
jgi:hypothetical protein